jgi:hypothetical protein
MFSYTSSRRTYSTVFWCDCVDEDIYQLVETRTEDVVQAPPPHLANLSRSLFQYPWTLPDMTPSTVHLHSPTGPPFPPLSTSTSISTFLTNPTVSFVRVRNSEIHPHSPVKVVKVDWGHSTSTAVSFEPNLSATWLGHVVSAYHSGHR